MEKTRRKGRAPGLPQKHLHGRGEDAKRQKAGVSGVETPPRTWRRHPFFFVPYVKFRNTSTDVEKTRRGHCAAKQAKKHLHGRGEDLIVVIKICRSQETPPRTWRRLLRRGSADVSCGNTSTDVEKTTLRTSSQIAYKKHLHGRGEDRNRPSVDT